VIAGHLTVGDIVAANLYVLMMIWPLRMIGMLLAQLPRSAAAGGRINGVLVTDPAIEDVPHAKPLPEGPGRVEFADVTFGYGANRPVLDHMELVIPGGQAIALDRRASHPALLRHRLRAHQGRRRRRARRPTA
jgi:ATP-binding cassette subfamily B protein